MLQIQEAHPCESGGKEMLEGNKMIENKFSELKKVRLKEASRCQTRRMNTDPHLDTSQGNSTTLRTENSKRENK